MNPISARPLLLLLSFVSLVAAAVDFAQCLDDFKATNKTGGVDSYGSPVHAANATGLTYETCRTQCGRTAESFSWTLFAQLFASWLLPWLALLSQLPLGSGNIGDGILSIIMSVGSPALAAYSLVITARNVRMVNKRASSAKHEARLDVAKMLIALQQQPHELTKNDLILHSIPEDKKWREQMLERLGKKNAWSLATTSTITWVVIAFCFTFVGSFVSLKGFNGGGSDGLAVGTLWFWVLCLVVGWLRVPVYSSDEIGGSISGLNKRTVKYINKKLMRPARDIVSRGKGTGPDNLEELERSNTPPIINVTGENGQEEQEPESNPSVPADHQREPNLHGIGETQNEDRSSTHAGRLARAQPDAAVSVASLDYEKNKLLIPFTDVGWLHRDESRHPPTFNYSRIMRYHVLVDDTFRFLERAEMVRDLEAKSPRPDSRSTALTSPGENQGVDLENLPPITQERGVFPRGTKRTMTYAAILGLLLQFGTTGAAVIIIVYTPTVGLGCRSLGYLIYGWIAITIMFLTILSTILARISEINQDNSLKRFTKSLAVTIRCTCLVLAVLNSVGLIVLCCFQFSNFLANCYCNASVLGNGTNTYLVVILTDLIGMMRYARIYGVATAVGSISAFIIFLRFVSSYDLP